MNRSDLQILAELRIEEAKLLMQSEPKRPDGAYYLAGYAVECALKACIAKTTHQYDFPDKMHATKCFTHDIEKLVSIAALEDDRLMDVGTNLARKIHWEIVKDWSEESRYLRHSELKAQKLIDAITDNANGVLPWIKSHW